MNINLTFIEDVIVLALCVFILIQGTANLLRRNPTITSEKNFIWFLLSFFGFKFINKIGSDVRMLQTHPEDFFISVGFMVYLIVAVIIIVILASRGKVTYGYIVSGADRDSILKAVSRGLEESHVEYTFSNSKFHLPTLNSSLEVKYYKWLGSTRLRIEGVGNQRLLNEMVRSLKYENKSLLRFNNRASLIELSIGLLGLILPLYEILKLWKGAR